MGGHALLIPLPYQGHINPMMQLAWKLVSDGFLVTFLNTDFTHNRIMQARTRNLNPNIWDGIRMISIPDGLPPDVERSKIQIVLEALDNSMAPPVIKRLIEEINEREEEHKITGIIVDAIISFGLKDVADFYQIPLFAFHASLVANFAIRYFIPGLVSLGILAPDGKNIESVRIFGIFVSFFFYFSAVVRLVVFRVIEGAPKEEKKIRYISSMPPLRSEDLPWLFGGEKMFKRCIRMADSVKQIKRVLSNSFYELDGPVVEELNREVEVYPIGPLIPPEFLEGDTISKALPSFWEDDLECLEWLDKQRIQSVIYVSFGSLAVWSKTQVEEFAAGLETTHRPFLWVVRSDLMEGSKPTFGPGFLERVGDRGCIVSWAPQLRVLSHPSIACFVTHCGWNSVQESITMGVPMLCSPYFVDQFLNRTYIVDVWKIGLPLESNKDGVITEEEIVKAVDRLLVGEDGAEIRKQASKLMRTSRDTVKERGNSFNNYSIFLRHMKKQLID